MFISDAYAKNTPAGAADVGLFEQIMGSGLPMMLAIVAVFYFLLIRPQQQARKRLTDQISALKKNDIVVTSGGFIGKVRSLAEDELRVELAPNVEVRLLRGAIAEVRSKSDPAPANDSKPASAD